jgi:hypothetical protein
LRFPLNQVSIYFNLVGSVTDEKFLPIGACGSRRVVRRLIDKFQMQLIASNRWAAHLRVLVILSSRLIFLPSRVIGCLQLANFPLAIVDHVFR